MTERTVTVDGQGRETAQPDLAEVELWVEGRHDSAEVARRQARDTEVSVRDALATEGISGEQVRTTSFRIEHRDDAFQFDERDPDYRAVCSLTVDCVPETAGDAVTAVVDAGRGVGIETVTFDVGDATRAELEERAVADAMASARGKAEAIAAAEGLTVGPVVDVTTTDARGSDGVDGIVDEALDAVDRTFEPAPVEVDAGVEARFELREGDRS